MAKQGPFLGSLLNNRRPLLLGFCFLLGFLVGVFDTRRFEASFPDAVSRSFPGQTAEDDARALAGAGASRILVQQQLPAGPRLEAPVQLLVVTPTYNRPFQAMYLTRLAHTLRLVRPPVLWLVVETGWQSEESVALLMRTGLMYRHLVVQQFSTKHKDRGVHQRNHALDHIEQHALQGIVYFADDDNNYSVELFEEIRKVRRVGVLPVARLTEGADKTTIEGPVCSGGKVTGWHTTRESAAQRRFHSDLCGFAFNSSLMWEAGGPGRRRRGPVRFRDNIKEGFQETTFLEQLVGSEADMEGLADDCREVLAWHMRAEAASHSIYPTSWTLRASMNVTTAVRTPEAAAA